MKRREFLRQATALLSAGISQRAVTGLLTGVTSASVLASPSDYRALICIYLSGGNDGTNTLIRTDDDGYGAYAVRRGALAIPRPSILALGAGTSGHRYGVHPAAPAIQKLFSQGDLAFVANVGTLLAPTTLADYRAGRSLPAHLFSHIDQSAQWASPSADSRSADGWAGRLAEVMAASNLGGVVPLNIGIDQSSRWQSSSLAPGFVVNSRRIARLAAVTNAPTSVRSVAYRDLQATAAGAQDGLRRVWGDAGVRAMDLSSALYSASTVVPALATPVPADDFGRSLAMVARLISMRGVLGARRQTFFVELRGFDTHDNHLEEHEALLGTLSDGLIYLESALKEMGVWDRVTTFTMSDFGRTTTPNRTGLDHGWGNHHFVLGGAVDGGAVYGQFPELRSGSTTDLSAGRLLPTTAADQYSATLSRWMGLDDGALAIVHPRLSRFAVADLGFMRAA